MLPTHRPPTHPGEMLLKEFLEPLGVSQAEAATRMSIPFQRLNGIVKGRRAVSADAANGPYSLKYYQFDALDSDSPSESVSELCCSAECSDESCARDPRRT